MNFKELQEDLFEASKIKQDVPGRFAKIMLKDGNNVMAFFDKENNTYVIDASIKDLKKFRKWASRDALVDIQKTGKKVRLATGKKVSTIKVRVEMKADDDGKKIEKNNGKEVSL